MGAQPSEKLNVWILQIGEPLPIDSPDERLFRCGLLARTLAERGHQVRWWTSDFDHYKKVFRHPADRTVEVSPGYELELLQGCGYARNISPHRLKDHRLLGKKFARLAPQKPRPDVIWAAVPIVEMGLPAVQLAREWGCPVVLDSMDRWPDMFLDRVPSWARPLVKMGLRNQWRDTKAMFQGATALTGNCQSFVDWGLDHAGRTATEWDRPFFFGYPMPEISTEDRSVAERMWDELGVVLGGTNACFIGTVSESAFHLRELVEAWALLPATMRLVVCGEGDGKESILERTRDLPHITVCGWKTAAEIRVLMERCQLGMAPYRSTPNFLYNIPNKIPEYLAGGLAIVSSVEGEIGRLLKRADCGVTYPAGDPAALADTIRTLLADEPRLARMRQAASALFQSEFRADLVYPEIVDYLQAIVRR